jgi:hypothetical protein
MLQHKFFGRLRMPYDQNFELLVHTSTINLVYCFENILWLHSKAYKSMLVSFKVLHLVLIGCYNSNTLSLIDSVC